MGALGGEGLALLIRGAASLLPRLASGFSSLVLLVVVGRLWLVEGATSGTVGAAAAATVAAGCTIAIENERQPWSLLLPDGSS